MMGLNPLKSRSGGLVGLGASAHHSLLMERLGLDLFRVQCNFAFPDVIPKRC